MSDKALFSIVNDPCSWDLDDGLIPTCPDFDGGCFGGLVIINGEEYHTLPATGVCPFL